MEPAGRELITSILTTASPQGGMRATVIGLITLFIGATAVSALTFLLLVSLVISAALASAAVLFQGPEQALLSRLLALAVSLLALTVSLLALTVVFALLYKYVPDAAIGWRDVWLGGLLTVALFPLGKTAIGVYLSQASVGSAYGVAGSMVVLLVWVYYSALILFFGAEFTQAWATRQGGVTPSRTPSLGPRPDPKCGDPRPPPAGVNTPVGPRCATNRATVCPPAASSRSCREVRTMEAWSRRRPLSPW